MIKYDVFEQLIFFKNTVAVPKKLKKLGGREFRLFFSLRPEIHSDFHRAFYTVKIKATVPFSR